jgi:predicted RNA-binding Zn ribbon-like protein
MIYADMAHVVTRKTPTLQGSAFHLPGCKLCVAWVNSALPRPDAGQRPVSRIHLGVVERDLKSYDDLVDWMVAVEALPQDKAEKLQRQAKTAPQEAAAVFAQAVELRSFLEGLCEKLRQRQVPTPADVEGLNSYLTAVQPKLVLTAQARGPSWTWSDSLTLTSVLWSLTCSAAELITTEARHRVRQCAGKDCTLLFVDYDPGRNRRWCHMEACGSKVKGRDYYRHVLKPIRDARR